ncbi:MAG: hypothetical protein AB7G75_35230 [Candidatus Binatia bacterium]
MQKVVKPWTEIQLGFAFVAENEPPLSEASERPSAKERRTATARQKPSTLGQALAEAQGCLLEAQLREVSEQLLPLLEFCEASLTRALDVVPTRTTEPSLTTEELRSLRGIGQAQWLLTEQLTRHDIPGREKRGRRREG